MTDRQFGRLMDRAAKATGHAASLRRELTEAFEARYGASYGDLPNDEGDSIVEAIDYGSESSTVTVEECDRIMAEAGYPKRAVAHQNHEKSGADGNVGGTDAR